MELKDKTGKPVVVGLSPQYTAYQIAYADKPDKAVGMTMFLEKPATRERFFFHTQVVDAYSGRGLAGILVEQAMKDPGNADKTIIAICPFVLEWLKAHPESPLKWRRPDPVDLKFVQQTLGA